MSSQEDRGSEIQILARDRSLSNFTPNLMRLVADARAAGLQIVYAPHGLNEHSFDEVKYAPDEW